jgi:tetratricopeptide (TPR) repeat protein
MGRAADAVGTYERMLVDLDTMGRGDTQLAAVLSSNLGALLSSSGQTLRAREASARAVAILRDTGQQDPVVEAVYAKVLAELGDTASARPAIARALEQARGSGNPRMLAIALYNAASIALAGSDADGIEPFLREVEAARGAAAGADPGRLFRAALRAEAALARGDAAAAQRLVDAALPAASATPRSDAAWVRARIAAAAAQRRLGDLAQAQAHATQAVADARGALAGFEHSRWVGLALLELGRVQQARGDAAAARASWSESLEHLRVSEGAAGPTTEVVRAVLRGA